MKKLLLLVALVIFSCSSPTSNNTPDTNNPGTTNPDTNNPGTTDPDTNNPGTTDPDTNNPLYTSAELAGTWVGIYRDPLGTTKYFAFIIDANDTTQVSSSMKISSLETSQEATINLARSYIPEVHTITEDILKVDRNQDLGKIDFILNIKSSSTGSTVISNTTIAVEKI